MAIILLSLTALFATTTLGKDLGGPVSNKVVELDGNNGRILVFPHFSPGRMALLSDLSCSE
jgi:hypothetical protein